MRLFGDGYRDVERRDAVCRIVWRLRPAIVDRLSRSMEVADWICDIAAATQFQTIAQEFLLLEIMWCEIAFELECSSLCCADIGVTLGFVCQFLAVFIVSELFQFGQLT
ncbi:hypothetical protein F2Q70_00026465 [Brassica cretica]|uniref:Uncharacterized protein n=1 Tax=Brassica cretica TaxID=69181 RepID=A0A8S9L207_BRACR|nr:hypothetical protein F2Q70_00026465 [Brassica cretica]